MYISGLIQSNGEVKRGIKNSVIQYNKRGSTKRELPLQSEILFLIYTFLSFSVTVSVRKKPKPKHLKMVDQTLLLFINFTIVSRKFSKKNNCMAYYIKYCRIF